MRLLLACIALMAAGPAAAGDPRPLTGNEVAEAVFSAVEKRIIEGYYGPVDHELSGHGEPGKGRGKKAGKKKGLPPGLAKRDRLPPGLAKRATLPPGLARRSLPPDLERELPPPRRGTERTIVDDRLVLIELATGQVLDIVEDVLAR